MELFDEKIMKECLTIFDTFKKEIISENRFFLRDSILLSYIEEMLDKFKYPIKSGEKFYRARVVDENSIYKKSYSISEMGAPPLEKAIGGRANPDGISYLYLASNINTAIAEVRPWKKANVNIVSFEVLEDLLVFFPMLYVWKYKEGELNHFFWFSYLLNEEFSKPINPSKKIDYFAYFGANWTVIPVESGHRFRVKLDTNSGGNWTPIPV